MRSQLDTSSDSDSDDVSLPGLADLSSDESSSDSDSDDTHFLPVDGDPDDVSAHTFIPDYVQPISEPPDCTSMPRLSYPDAYASESDSHSSLHSYHYDDHDSIHVPDDMPSLADLSDDDEDVIPDPLYVLDTMPHLADPSDNDDDADTDDDASDGSLSMPDLVSLSSDDYNSDSDSDDEAHFLEADDASDDEDTPDYTQLESDIMNNTAAEVSLNTMLPSSQDHTVAQFMITTAELIIDDVVFATGSTSWCSRPAWATRPPRLTTPCAGWAEPCAMCMPTR